MEPKDYIVSRIEGEYAYLKRTDIESEEELFIVIHSNGTVAVGCRHRHEATL